MSVGDFEEEKIFEQDKNKEISDGDKSLRKP